MHSFVPLYTACRMHHSFICRLEYRKPLYDLVRPRACLPQDIGHSSAAREMLQELCIGELKDGRDAHAKREARKLERRSLLLMQSPATHKLYAERRKQQQTLQQHRRMDAWTKCAAAAVVFLAVAAAIYHQFIKSS